MREISLDTETTGFDPLTGDKIVEIGCVELINHIPTENTYQVYLNPERLVPEDSMRIHGLTDDFLSDKPIFPQVAQDFLSFIGDDTLVIHNAEFDLKFLNTELKNIGFSEIKNNIIDTLLIARQRFPGSPANLDALCRRFGIDNSNRSLHGALLDAELLAEVYLELCGGRQPELLKESKKKQDKNLDIGSGEKVFREARDFSITIAEQEMHAEMLNKIKDSNWN
jgi:DNA polymerase III subunit epsilon